MNWFKIKVFITVLIALATILFPRGVLACSSWSAQQDCRSLSQEQIFWSPTRCVASVQASGPTTKDLSYNDIVELKQKNKIILIDVREPIEIQETGLIPGSVHIPLGDLKNALQLLSPADFLKKYGFHKPKPDADLVFTCRSGKRSRDAIETAESVGFLKSRHYVGGFLDWQKHNPS